MADPETVDPTLPLGANGAFPQNEAASNGTHLTTSFPPHPQAGAESFQTLNFASASPSPPVPIMPGANGGTSTFGYSAATAELLRRMSENAAAHTGTPDYQAAREQILRGIVTSDKLPVPPPMTTGKRGRGGRGGLTRADSMARTSATPTAFQTPETTRGRPRGRPRGRGRGRGSGRGGKRKREDSDAEMSDVSMSDDGKLGSDGRMQGEDDEEDMSDSYTPLPTRTKSGRSITKPTQFIPTIQSPSSGQKKKRAYRRNPESALCKACDRGHSPANNQVVFCDGCGSAYHQYCHDPPIEKEVVLVPEKEWFCASCVRDRDEVITGSTLEGLVSGETMTREEKRNSLLTLDHSRLVDLLLHAAALHPSLPLFSKTQPSFSASTQIAAQSNAFPTPPITTAPSQSLTDLQPPITAENQPSSQAEQYDGYETDPPSHYPKPGTSAERTLQVESNDILNDLHDSGFIFGNEGTYDANHLEANDL